MTDPATPNSCPTCGAPITREDLSLCSYCGSPLQLGGAKETPEGEENPNTERLNRMKDKEEWAAAMAWEPLAASRYPGPRAVAIPLICGVLAALLSGLIFDYITALVIGSFIVFILLSAHVARSMRQRPASPLNPDASLLKRAAIVIDRRSETEMSGGEGQTTYYFILEFADAARGEFRFPGRGANFDLPVNGATGVAYTRGADLLTFKKIRV